MREIKFRAWDKEEDRFWYFTLQEILERRMDYRGSFDEKILLGDKQQYTGLKDNNGKEIYEGDIVEAEYCIDGCLYYIEDEYGVIQWDDEKCGFNLIFKDQLAPSPISYYVSFEVVGNIYENSDLLEKI